MVDKDGSKNLVKRSKVIKHKVFIIAVSIIAPILLVSIWYVASASGAINKAVLPSPGKIAGTFLKYMENGKLGENLLVSGIRVMKGFLIGAFAGIILGSFMGLSKTIYRFLNSLVGIFRPVPMIAWIPLLILWLGIGEESKVSVIVIGSFWPVLLNTIHGIHSVDVKMIEVASILEKSNYQILRKIILPAALPSIFTGIRIGMGSAWTCVVAAEMIAASKGIGYMITYARELSQSDVVLVGVFSIGVVGLSIDVGIQKLKTHLLKWNNAEK